MSTQLRPCLRLYNVPRRKRMLILNESHDKFEVKQSKVNETPSKTSSRRSRISRTILLLITGLICLAGGSWQLFTIFSNYLRYDIISQVYFEKDDSVVPPAFSICFPFAEFINASAISPKFNFINQTFWRNFNSSIEREEISAQIQGELTIADIFDKTPPFTEFLESVFVRVRGTYRVNYRDSSDVSFSKYVKDDLVCYQIHYKGQNKMFQQPKFTLRSHHITYGQEPGVHMIIRLSREKIYHVSKAIVYFHLFGQLPRGDRDFPLNFITFDSSQLFANSSSYIGLTYYKTNLNLLEAPYSTDCRNFSDFKASFAPEKIFESEYHCIHYCMRVKSLIKFNATSFTSTFQRPHDFHIIKKYLIYTDPVFQRQFDSLFDQCVNLCPGASCKQIFFMPALIATRESDDVVFLVYDMAGLETTASFQPKMGLVELMVQVLSVSGVWLGLSCVDIIMNIIRLLAREPQPSLKRHRYVGKIPVIKRN